MTLQEADPLQGIARSNWVRLRTLVILRWFAIGGQCAAIAVAWVIYDIRFALGPAALAIGASVVANLIFTVVFPGNRRLTEREAILMIVFDILQLALLLFITGGLTNPFALLILAPVAIGATILRLRHAIVLAGLSILLVSALVWWHLPLTQGGPDPITLPEIYLFGFWIALVIGIAFIASYARQVTDEVQLMNEALVATQLALAREQKLTDLGGVVAAAAHELGTPLATIKLVSGELLEELTDRPELAEDVTLIRDQSDRCRDILQSMGRAGKSDRHLRHAPLETVIREAAEPHLDRGKSVIFEVRPSDGSDGKQPNILRRPEIVHGLRNLIQNAVDFADYSVEIEVEWTDDQVSLRIEDDGAGFPSAILGRIGDPFVRRRRGADEPERRPGYEGMGLGLFIAKTLLERTGAELSFANAQSDQSSPGGAVVTVLWDRATVEAEHYAPLGPNALLVG